MEKLDALIFPKREGVPFLYGFGDSLSNDMQRKRASFQFVMLCDSRYFRLVFNFLAEQFSFSQEFVHETLILADDEARHVVIEVPEVNFPLELVREKLQHRSTQNQRASNE